MNKQYIYEYSISHIHDLDVLGVFSGSKHTITVSSDGKACFFIKTGNGYVMERKIKIHDMGIHHVAVWERGEKGTIVAYACFDGILRFGFFKEELDSYVDIGEVAEVEGECWCPGFYVWIDEKQEERVYLITTRSTGKTRVDNFYFDEGRIRVVKYGELGGKTQCFANSLAISKTSDKKVAVGYANGNVTLYDMDLLKDIYTFQSSDLSISNTNEITDSIPRSMAFSPGTSILAVARDNQSSGLITFYDVIFGDNIGSLLVPSNSLKTAISGFAHDGWITGLSFNENGNMLASCGFDNVVRIWDVEKRQKISSIGISANDFETISEEENKEEDELDNSVPSGVVFTKNNVNDHNGTKEGLCIISFDRGIRWYREAGGV